jgi:hypothetical protein
MPTPRLLLLMFYSHLKSNVPIMDIAIVKPNLLKVAASDGSSQERRRRAEFQSLIFCLAFGARAALLTAMTMMTNQ